MHDVIRCRRFIAHVVAETRFADGGPRVPTPAEILGLVVKCGLTTDDFIELDERPAIFDEGYHFTGWFRSLRMLRNDDVYGDSLFDALARNAQALETERRAW